MAKKTVTQGLREYFAKGRNENQTNPEVAAKFACDPSLVSRIRREVSGEEILSSGVKQRPAKVSSAMSMSVSLRTPEDTLEIKVHNGDCRIKGTLVVSLEGIRFRHAKQKKPADRILSYQNLDKIMQLGLL